MRSWSEERRVERKSERGILGDVVNLVLGSKDQNTYVLDLTDDGVFN
jgi:hypothetical protein